MENSRDANRKPPDYGLKIKLDHEYPEKKLPNSKPKWRQALPLVPLGIRYLAYVYKTRFRGKKPYMDFVNLETAKQIYGCPLGGIGGGTIGRGFKGEFCRYQLIPGIYEYVTIPENQFIVNIRDSNNDTIFQSVMSTYAKSKKAPMSWEWNLKGSDCDYTGLYPRAWTSYDLSQYGVKLMCRQISPVIPNNYKDSSLPCAVFVWEVENVCNEVRNVSITFTFKDVASPKTKTLNSDSINFERYSDVHTCGVSLEQSISDMMCTFTISKMKQSADSCTDGFCKFNTKKTAGLLWDCIKSKGRLIPNDIPSTIAQPNAIGLSSQIMLEPGTKGDLEFCLVWDMPIVHFGNKLHKHNRYYTRFFGRDGIAGPSIASYALSNYKKWEEDIYSWQSPILDDKSLPDWYKGALMNELYFVTDGGTVWFDVSDQCSRDDPRWNYGVFGYLEGHEYRMYNTYDVHFYASFALAQLWPRLQISIQYQFKDTVMQEFSGPRKHLYSGKSAMRKEAQCVPHDLGDPDEEPFVLINAYNIHNVSEWRDLNLKFILQAYRDMTLLKTERIQQDTSERYQSLEFIDDESEAHEDLYVRSTNQTNHNSSVGQKLNAVLNSHSDKSTTPKQLNGFCKYGDNDIKLNYIGPREKHVSISSDCGEDDLSHSKYHNPSRKGSSGKPFILYSQLSQCSEGMVEAILVEDVVDSDRFLKDMYPTCRALVDKMLSWDTDDDGLIENIGAPDQTFDAWIMTGPSAYCGGLWLAALQCMYTMACMQGLQEDMKFFFKLLEKGKVSFEKLLWNGKFYEFDKDNRVIMADQLCGHWYLRASGYQYPVFPKENVLSALHQIYQHNVLQFAEGTLGAVNGFIPTTEDKVGHVDIISVQSEESWTGVTYGLAALMLHEGMTEEAFKTAGGMYNSLSNRFGLSFETPEALYENGSYRSIGYMRPLSIWAMQLAIRNRPAVSV